MVGVAVGVDHPFDGESLAAGQVKIGMKVPERVDHQCLPGARYHVTQTPARGSAHLIELQLGTLEDGAGGIVRTPGFHSSLEVSAGVAETPQTLGNIF